MRFTDVLNYIHGISSSVGGLPPFKPDEFSSQNDTNEPYLDFLNYALDQDSFPQVLSTSYGDDEQTVRFTWSNTITWNITCPPGATRLCSESL